MQSKDIQSMFGIIARRYDVTNTILSGGVHHLWKRAAIAAAAPRSGETALDLCCGTGDLLVHLVAKLGDTGRAIGVDFTHEMLALARRKTRAFKMGAQTDLVQGDAVALPFPDLTFDIVTIAFGIRNVIDPAAALSEIRRVLRDNGRLVVLEFGRPSRSLGGRMYRWYAEHVLPVIGGLVTGNRNAYRYLPETACRYTTGEEFLQLLREAGFANASWQPLLWGIAHIYTASSKDVSVDLFPGIRGASNA